VNLAAADGEIDSLEDFLAVHRHVEALDHELF
jgi:hypothetical protein